MALRPPPPSPGDLVDAPGPDGSAEELPDSAALAQRSPRQAPEEPPSPEAFGEAELPEGVEPWSGKDMPTGTASGHERLAPEHDPPEHDPPEHDPPEQPELAAPELATPQAASLDRGLDAGPRQDELNYRQLYEHRFRGLELGAREEAARQATAGELFALCLDPAPQVIAALLDNPEFGLAHARSAALHHSSDRGLEVLARRAQLLRDAQVQRRLLQNVQTPEVVIDRLLRSKRLLELYRLSIDRDLPERNRLRVRSRLRPAFMRAEPEDRAALVIKTEGRCLMNLSGCTFDARMTQILCSQTIVSTLFIQNLARFGATPPALISKLLRSPAVQRQPALRALLSKHPNATAEAKRRG